MPQINFIILAETEEAARETTKNWFSHLPNLSVDKVTPHQQDGYHIWISYDEENNSN